MQKKLLALGLALAMVLGLCACGKSVSGTGTTSAAPSTGTSAAADGGSDTTNGTGAASGDVTKVGFIYIGDDSEPYTANFIEAQNQIAETYGDKVETLAKYKVTESADDVNTAVEDLVNAGCNIVFSTSFGFGEFVKEAAVKYPDVQFCQATCADADGTPANYHNYMGEIYQGRYISGVVAGLKLQQLIDDGTVTADQAKVGYVGAFPYAEVISGYTAFLMGVRSVVLDATMEVQYAGSWGDYEKEKQIAQTLIEDGCVIISQHSDTEGPAEACEEASKSGTTVFQVGYNQSMNDIAPDVSLISSRIDWAPYELAAVQAVMDGTEIAVDEWAGFDKGWVAMTELNTAIAADGTQDRIDKLEQAFSDGSVTSTDVFVGDFDATDADGNTISLKDGYEENADHSAPSFSYIIDSIITVIGK